MTPPRPPYADSELPADWLDVVAQADQDAAVVAGAFRLALDSADWQARIIEAGARLRGALFGLPYGDQALFVRRHVFDDMGGYRDLPLMEDIDFVRRVRNSGRLLRSRSPVLTSARRWEREGHWRASCPARSSNPGGSRTTPENRRVLGGLRGDRHRQPPEGPLG